MKKCLLPLFAVLAFCGGMLSCGGSGAAGAAKDSDSVQSHPLPDTLRVVTLYSPTSYFIYRDEPMGYDYSLVRTLAAEKGMKLEIEVAPSLAAAVDMLEDGRADLLASRVPVTDEYVRRVRHCGPEISTSQVLVQRRTPGDSLVKDVTQLPGRTVWVEGRSKYEQRMNHLNQELGGEIDVRSVSPDSLITEDLISMVSDGTIPLTVVDSDIARLDKTYYPDLDITLELSFGQNARWAVAKDKAWLADSVDVWLGGEYPRRENDILLRRYFEISKNMPNALTYRFDHGHMSVYDDIFRKYAARLGWDWRMLGAICYVESRFDPSVVSWAGAKGIMQIMPSTGRLYGVTPAQMTDPETSVATAVKILEVLDKSYAKSVPDKAERMKFILAAYNSGPGHINDAIALARKYNHNPSVWYGHVADCLLLKSHAEYYNDPVCRNGYFRGRQTIEYVDQVMAFYNRAIKSVKK